ncbi:MAG: hypothetical protein WCY58_05510 [Mariniphaga sp.]|nr:hypothetical protein [Mariniphaga sp.]MDD4227163.1 hypothetical protein [Mariniphaga sp.]MDD4425932.1 hypothetical protein [Mariniphaga sp.]
MPYRRLPTTDKARLRALETALNTANDRDSGKLAFSKATLIELKEVKFNFETHLIHHNLDVKIESEKATDYKLTYEKARMYISHFIQVLYMTIERGELNQDALVYYDLNDMDRKIPGLGSEQEILQWGNKIIQGEQKRMQRGGSPIYNPSIALVKVNVENFNEAAIFQANLRKNTLRSFEKIQRIRKDTNEFISRLWNEIETNSENLPSSHMRQRSEEYGVVYVYRRQEKKKIKIEGMQIDLLFEFN